MRYMHLRPHPGMKLHLKATLLAGVLMILAPWGRNGTVDRGHLALRGPLGLSPVAEG